mmetsp:Transcript_86395/g.172884  ORF Transcript_86395/g.172884 Transcript_86395/m.172884 type:complete len:275 (+) Transcript_86395:1269-2093(+)
MNTAPSRAVVGVGWVLCSTDARGRRKSLKEGPPTSRAVVGHDARLVSADPEVFTPGLLSHPPVLAVETVHGRRFGAFEAEVAGGAGGQRSPKPPHVAHVARRTDHRFGQAVVWAHEPNRTRQARRLPRARLEGAWEAASEVESVLKRTARAVGAAQRHQPGAVAALVAPCVVLKLHSRLCEVEAVESHLHERHPTNLKGACSAARGDASKNLRGDKRRANHRRVKPTRERSGVEKVTADDEHWELSGGEPAVRRHGGHGSFTHVEELQTTRTRS